MTSGEQAREIKLHQIEKSSITTINLDKLKLIFDWYQQDIKHLLVFLAPNVIFIGQNGERYWARRQPSPISFYS